MLSNYFEYPAAYTRTRGNKAKLLGADEWNALTKSKDLFHALNSLLETDYRDAFEWTTLHPDALPSLRSVEHLFRCSTISSILKIIRFLSGHPAEVLTILIQKYELLNLKKTLRRLNQPELRENHLSIANYDMERCGLIPGLNWDEIKKPEELASLLQPTYYGYAYSKGQSVFTSVNDLLIFECSLEKVYFNELSGVVSRAVLSSNAPSRVLIGNYIDEVCLTSYIRLRYENEMDFPAVLPLLPLSGSRKVNAVFLQKFADISDEEDFFDKLASEKGWKHIAGSNLPETILNMRKNRITDCRKIFVKGLSLNVAPAVAFYFLKEQEVEEIISLLQSKRFSVEPIKDIHCLAL